MPSDKPFIFTLPKPRPMVIISDNITTACIDECMVNRLFIQSVIAT
ncbi:unknown [Prevotella sp. CAG:1092]|nr:unknown [Prevotella sp. CAG:1092]